MGAKTIIPSKAIALYVQGINMVLEIDDDEEEAFLAANHLVVPVFDIDVV